MMWNNFNWLRSLPGAPAGTDAGLEFMRTAFPDPQFIRLRREDKVRQGTLPPVRYRKQADSLTDRYAGLVRSAMNAPG